MKQMQLHLLQPLPNYTLLYFTCVRDHSARETVALVYSCVFTELRGSR